MNKHLSDDRDKHADLYKKYRHRVNVLDGIDNVFISGQIDIVDEPKDLVSPLTLRVIGKWLRGWEIFQDIAGEHIHSKSVQELVELESGVQFQLALKVGFKKYNTDEREEFIDPVLRHYSEIIMNADNIKDIVGSTNALERLEK